MSLFEYSAAVDTLRGYACPFSVWRLLLYGVPGNPSEYCYYHTSAYSRHPYSVIIFSMGGSVLVITMQLFAPPGCSLQAVRNVSRGLILFLLNIRHTVISKKMCKFAIEHNQ